MDSHLYGPDGKFLFRGKKIGICALGGEKDYTYDVGALGPSMRFCRACITKNTPGALRRDANIALQRAVNAHDHFSHELREMGKRYRAKFNTSISWDLPQVIEQGKVRK